MKLRDSGFSLFPERMIEVGGQKVTIRPLNFYEMMTQVPDIIGRIMDNVEEMEQSNLAALIPICSREIYALLSQITGKNDDFWMGVPAEDGFKAITEFLEVNLSQNFFDQAAKCMKVSQEIGSKLFKPS